MDDFTLKPGFSYYYVSHELWGKVSGQIKNDDTRHLQYVPSGSSVYSTAAKGGAWLSQARQTLTRLVIVGHGSPGQFFLGENITSGNIAPLGGWLSSFFESDSTGIQILGCQAAADSSQRIGGYEYGQAHPLSEQSLSHQGYELLRELARASNQTVEGALYGQSIVGVRLKNMCRRVYPDGTDEIFDAG